VGCREGNGDEHVMKNHSTELVFDIMVSMAQGSPLGGLGKLRSRY
jgi:hypothetical protein